MEQNFIATLAASLIAGIVTTAGILAIRRFEAWARENTTYFACFAAGVLIAVPFLHIVPKSFAMSPQAPIWLFAGYLLMHLFNRFLTAHVCDKPATAEYALGLVPLLGIGFHSFLADFAPHDAGRLAHRLEERGILVKPLNDRRLGPGFMRVTTALPEDNLRFLSTLEELL